MERGTQPWVRRLLPSYRLGLYASCIFCGALKGNQWLYHPVALIEIPTQVSVSSLILETCPGL